MLFWAHVLGDAGALREWGLGIKAAWMGAGPLLEGLRASRSSFGAAAGLKFGLIRGEKYVCALVVAQF